MFAVLLLCFTLASADRLSRIVGGADAGGSGHQVALLSKGVLQCSGVIINEDWVISAAHCVDGDGPYSVVVNDYDRSKNDDNEQTIEVATVIQHPNYMQGTGSYPNNLALLKLAVPIQGSFSSLPLQTRAVDAPVPCTISGWGLMSGGQLPTILQSATGTTLTTSGCQFEWGKLGLAHAITTDHICFDSATAAACNVDSGGPMDCTQSDGTVVLCGVATFGKAGCDVGTPSVYTRISSYASWINTIITNV